MPPAFFHCPTGWQEQRIIDLPVMLRYEETLCLGI